MKKAAKASTHGSTKPASNDEPLVTPDKRYIIVKARLWRTANPQLTARKRDALVKDLMAARRAVASAKRSGDAAALKAARTQVQTAKVGLGERGPVWWKDGSPDYNRYLVKNTPYAAWYQERMKR